MSENNPGTPPREDGWTMHTTMRAPRAPRRTATSLAATAVVAAALVTVPAAQAGAVSAPSALAAVKAAGPVSAGGPVVGTSCSAGCDLWAKAGTVTVGGTPLPVWNFTAGDTAVTGANPVIEAGVGDTLTITLHNSLTVPVSLAIPGLAGVATDYVGVAPGASKQYSFAASRAGTFVYQAGHLTTADDPGPREVAMGLAGALVIRPAGAAGQALTESSPASAFDDEAVMVLSEIDPLFALNPLTYDLREFHGTYRLINGAAWPETTQIGTAPGHKVLLRYVNGGVGSASMGLLGLKQSVVAQNGYPAYGQALVSDTLQAGTTEDTIVSVPAPVPAGGGNYLLLDSTGGLDTNGMVDGSTNKQLAFGGRMTVLTATGGLGGVVTPTGDTVGPDTTTLTLSPNPVPTPVPAGGVTLTATFVDPKITVGSSTFGPTVVDAAEYTFDANVAAGSGTPFTAVPANSPTGTVTATMVIPAAELAGKSGAVTVYVRGRDSAGNWGPTGTVTLNIPNGGPKVTNLAVAPALTNGSADVTLSGTGNDAAIGGDISTMGYVVDGTCTMDPAPTPTSCTPMTVGTGSGGIRAATATIPASVLGVLSQGAHTITVMALDSLNLTGSATVALTIDKNPPSMTGGGVNPAVTNGTVGDPVDPTSLRVFGTFSDVDSKVVAAEGFLDNVPVVDGHGFVMVAADGSFNGATENAYGLVPLSEVTAMSDGLHIISVHARDSAGNWGATSPITLTVDRTKPTVSIQSATQVAGVNGRVTVAVTVTNSGTAATPISGAEYFLGTTDPGAGNGTAVNGAVVAGANSLTLNNVPVGQQTLFVRVKDQAGNWSSPVSTTVRVYTEPIFSDTFGTNAAGSWTGSPWAVTGGAARVATTSAMQLDGSRAMQTNTNGTTASYVTTPTLATGSAGNPPASRYSARFLFNRNTLTASGNGVTILALRSGNTTERAAVRFRMSSGTPQIALSIAGVSPTSAAWVNLPNTGTGSNTIRIDWQAGGTVTLYADATRTGGPTSVRTAPSGTGAASTVDRVRVGEVSGATGSAYFDYFTASRLGLPQ